MKKAGGPREDAATIRKDGDAVFTRLAEGLYHAVLEGVAYFIQDTGRKSTLDGGPWVVVGGGAVLAEGHETMKDAENEAVVLVLAGLGL